MNINKVFTAEELATLIASCDDREGHHVLWIDEGGEVYISLLPRHMTPVGFEYSQPTMKLRLATFAQNLNYVGAETAQDKKWVALVLEALVKHWPEAQVSKRPICIDYF